MTWRHVSDCGTPDDDPFCGCTTPTPDPASPCAVCGVAGGRHERVLGLSPWCCPTHVPTRCTCGNPITKEEKP